MSIALSSVLAAAMVAVPMPLKLADGVSWTLVAERSSSTEADGKSTTWSTRTEKSLTYRKGAGGFFGSNLDSVIVTPVRAETSAGAPKGVACCLSFPVTAALNVDHQMMPVGLADPKPARDRYAQMPEGQGKKPGPSMDTAIMSMVAWELAVTSRAQNTPLVPGKPYEYATRIPEPIFGLVVGAKATFVLESYEPEKGQAVIQWRQVMDPASYKATMDTVTGAMAKRNPGTGEGGRASPLTAEMVHEENCRYEIDLATGLATSSTCETLTTSTLGGAVRKFSRKWNVTQTLPGQP